jgi:hypothetical protein
VTDTSSTPPPAAPVASDLGALTPEAAQAAIQSRINDKEFYARLTGIDAALKAAASAEWSQLHRLAHPRPTDIASEADVALQAAARQAEEINHYLAAYLKIADLSPLQQEEIRTLKPIPAEAKQFAKAEIERMKRDKAFVRRVLDGDREATSVWSRMHIALAMPTASAK